MIPTELWKLYHTKIRYYIMGKVSDNYEAEDLFQEVGFRVIKSENKIPQVKNIEAWLYRIADNAVIDYYRRKNRFIYLEDMDTVKSKEPYSAESDNYNGETGSCLLEMTEYLPKNYQEAIIKSDYKGLQQNRLKEEWGLSYSGAKNRVQRARKKLKETMLDCCDVTVDKQGNIIELEQKSREGEKYSCERC